MSDPTESFIRTFEKIVAEVNRRAGVPSSRSFELERAAERDGIVKKNHSLLRYIRSVRNALQHPQHHSKGHAVQVSEAFLDEVRTLLNYLRNPPTVSSIGVPRKKIKTAGLSDELGDLANDMKRGGFSHVPILNKFGAIIGVFNEAAVFDYLWAETEIIIGREMQISDIFTHCRLDAGHTESFRFVKPGTLIDDLAEMFRVPESPTTRLGAAFVTASGKKTEPLQRLVTAWDVLASSSK